MSRKKKDTETTKYRVVVDTWPATVSSTDVVRYRFRNIKTHRDGNMPLTAELLVQYLIENGAVIVIEEKI